MPRYIDRDKFMQNLEADKYGHTDCARVGRALDKAAVDFVEEMTKKLCGLFEADCDSCPAAEHCYKGHTGWRYLLESGVDTK